MFKNREKESANTKSKTEFARFAERSSPSKIWRAITSFLGAKAAKRFMKTCKCYAKAAMRANRIAHQ